MSFVDLVVNSYKTFTMKKFEYKVVRVETISMMKYKYDFAETEAMLTGFGLEGWELTNVVQDTGTDARKYLILFLKREIENA